MMQLSLAVLQQKAQKAIDSLRVSQLDPDDFCEFFWTPPSQELQQQITCAVFLAEDAPPGTYRFVQKDADGAIQIDLEGAKYELRFDGAEKQSNPMADVARATSVLLHSSAAEVERVFRRLAESEGREEKLRGELDLVRKELREKEREIAGLEVLIEELESDDDAERLAEVLKDVLVKWLGIEEPEEAQAEAFESILEVIRKSEDVQKALVSSGAGGQLKLLGIGGEP